MFGHVSGILENAKILLVDLGRSSLLCMRLRRTLEISHDLKWEIRAVSLRDQEMEHTQSICSDAMNRFRPDIVFLILQAEQIAQAGALLHNDIPAIAVAESCCLDDMFAALKLGISDFVAPPFNHSDIVLRIWRILKQKHLRDSLTDTLKKQIGLRELVGTSPAFLICINNIPLIAQCDASVLISGETGTGKELCARAIHYLSLRADKPFLPVTCGAIPTELVENELFGHVQGAYTNAHTSSAGLIREAEGGTMFLDEIDCLPLQAQVKLMRVLQEKEYRQLGSPKIHQADIRIIAATNIDLEQSIRHGRFRPDLFYRLNIISLSLPPLRERKEDIPLLARYFLKKHAPEFKKDVSGFSPEAMNKLLGHGWPGNVRELENLIERAVIFAQHQTIQHYDIVLPDQPHSSGRESFREAKSRCIEKFERDYIRQLLLEHQGNITQAAKAARKNRRAFWELMRKHSVEHQHFKPGHS